MVPQKPGHLRALRLGRGWLVALTEAGEALATEIATQRRRFFAEIVAALEPEEQTELVRLTAKAADALRIRSEEVIRG